MSKNETLAKNTIILTIGQFIPKLIAMITLPIITEAFSTEDYGIYDLIISFASLFMPLMTFMVQQAVFRYMISEKEDNYKNYIVTSIFFVLGISLIMFCIVVIIGSQIPQYFELLILAIVLYFCESIYDLIGQIARGYGKNLMYSIAVIMYSVFNMILLLVVVMFDFVNIKSALIVLSISYLLVTIFLFTKLKLHKILKIKYFSFNILKKMLKYSVPIIPSSISLWIVNLSDRLIITYFLGNAYNGIYAAASKIPNLLVTFYNAFNLAWTELAARSIDEKDSNEYYSKLIDNLCTFFFGVLIALMAISPILYKILIDEKFNEGISQMPILFIGIAFSCLVSFYGGLYVALKKTKQVGVSSTVGAILNIVINILLIKKIGLYAASLSTVISFLIILIYRIFELKKYLKIKYNIKNIIIGTIFLTISIFNYYNFNLSILIINIFIAILYNLLYNKLILLIFTKAKEKVFKKSL